MLESIIAIGKNACTAMKEYGEHFRHVQEWNANVDRAFIDWNRGSKFIDRQILPYEDCRYCSRR